jgi:hypothetical protein
VTGFIIAEKKAIDRLDFQIVLYASFVDAQLICARSLTEKRFFGSNL